MSADRSRRRIPRDAYLAVAISVAVWWFAKDATIEYTLGLLFGGLTMWLWITPED